MLSTCKLQTQEPVRNHNHPCYSLILQFQAQILVLFTWLPRFVLLLILNLMVHQDPTLALLDNFQFILHTCTCLLENILILWGENECWPLAGIRVCFLAFRIYKYPSNLYGKFLKIISFKKYISMTVHSFAWPGKCIVKIASKCN